MNEQVQREIERDEKKKKRKDAEDKGKKEN